MAGRTTYFMVALCLTTLIISQGVHAAPPPSELDTSKEINNRNDSFSGVHKEHLEAENQKRGSMEELPGHSAYKAVMKCLEGWTEWKDACYFFDPNSHKTWHEGRMDCVRKSQGRGDLVSIHSEQENSLVNLMSDGAWVWIGFYLKSETHAEENFRWSDNTQRGYTNWAPNEPSDKDGNEDCTEMEPIKGLWNDIDCTGFYPYICKGPKVMMCSGMVV